jgi:hypothetical protein
MSLTNSTRSFGAYAATMSAEWVESTSSTRTGRVASPSVISRSNGMGPPGCAEHVLDPVDHAEVAFDDHAVVGHCAEHGSLRW